MVLPAQDDFVRVRPGRLVENVVYSGRTRRVSLTSTSKSAKETTVGYLTHGTRSGRPQEGATHFALRSANHRITETRRFKDEQRQYAKNYL